MKICNIQICKTTHKNLNLYMNKQTKYQLQSNKVVKQPKNINLCLLSPQF